MNLVTANVHAIDLITRRNRLQSWEKNTIFPLLGQYVFTGPHPRWFAYWRYLGIRQREFLERVANGCGVEVIECLQAFRCFIDEEGEVFLP